MSTTGNAIATIDSRFVVHNAIEMININYPLCPSRGGAHSTFTGWNYAIESVTSGLPSEANVFFAEFQNNHNAIYLEAELDSKIYGCQIIVNDDIRNIFNGAT